MDIIFEEIDFQETPLGEISLRRRSEPRLDGKVLYEVKLGEEFLMSSLFTEAEIQLTKLALAELQKAGFHSNMDVVVGGLGLGYTAQAALESTAVGSLEVIEIMAPVIDWHRRGLVPIGDILATDERCRLRQDDFFALATKDVDSFNSDMSRGPVHAVLLDIDHSPTHWLHQENQTFYTRESLRSVAKKIRPNGVFGLWSDDPPDSEFVQLMETEFVNVQTHSVFFPNPYTGSESANTVYLASKA